MRSDNRIQLRIGAVFAKNFFPTFDKAEKVVKKFDKLVSKTESAVNATKKYKEVQQSVNKLEKEYKQAKEELKKFSGASLEAATKQKQLKNKVDEINRSLNREKDTLSKTERTLKEYGISTRNVANEQKNLNRQLEYQNKIASIRARGMKAAGMFKGMKRAGHGMISEGFMNFGAGSAMLYGMHNFFKEPMALQKTMALITAQNDEEVFNRGNLRNKIRDLAITRGLSVSKIADLSLGLQKAGFGYSYQTQGGFLDTMVNMAVGSGESPEVALTSLSQIQSAFGSYMKRAGITARDAMNMVQKAANDSIISISDLNESMKYLAPSFKAMGGNATLEDALAFITLVGKSGLKGGLATRALKTSFARLAAPTKKMKDTIAAYADPVYGVGVDFDIYDDFGRFKGMQTALEELVKIKEKTTPRAFKAFVKEVFGGEAITAIENVVSEGKKSLREYSEELDNLRAAAKQDLINKQVAETMNTAGQQVSILVQNIRELANTVFFEGESGKALVSMLKDASGVIKNITTYLREDPIGQKIARHLPAMIVGFGAFNLAVGTTQMLVGNVLRVFGGLGMGVVDVVIKIQLLKATMKFLTGEAILFNTAAMGGLFNVSKWGFLASTITNIRNLAMGMWAAIAGPALPWIAGTAAIGAAGYFGYKAFKKHKENQTKNFLGIDPSNLSYTSADPNKEYSLMEQQMASKKNKVLNELTSFSNQLQNVTSNDSYVINITTKEGADNNELADKVKEVLKDLKFKSFKDSSVLAAGQPSSVMVGGSLY